MDNHATRDGRSDFAHGASGDRAAEPHILELATTKVWIVTRNRLEVEVLTARASASREIQETRTGAIDLRKVDFAQYVVKSNKGHCRILSTDQAVSTP